MRRPVWNKISDRNRELGPDKEPERKGRHWRLYREREGVAWLLFDREGESVNTISPDVMTELDEMLGFVEETKPRALVLRSAKPSGMGAGADIRDFPGVDSSTEVVERLRDYHKVVDRLAALDMPTVAVMHGICVGGALELSLACKSRIALADAKLGLPEVKLGLHPGAGGTFRLPELIDPVEAMKLMLTGKIIPASRAKSLGIVDAVVEERHVAAAVDAAIAGELDQGGRSWKASAIDTGPGRRMAAQRMRAETEKRAPREHYPAPYALIDNWEKHGGDRKAMQDAEIETFAELMVGDTAQNLVRVFLLRERLKTLGKKAKRRIDRVHVVGAGEMGADIAAWCALKGIRTSLTDLDPETLAKAMGRASKLFDEKASSSLELRDARDRLIPDFAGDGATSADVVIEAIVEKVEPKRRVYAQLADRMKPDAVLATNTSAIPLEDLREGLKRPGRFVGLHFFNPVDKMQLVEVVSHDQAEEEALDAARALCSRMDRLPAPVKSATGFLVNRILTPYLVEAMIMLDEGADPEVVDKAAKDFGMAMGPIEVADRVGLDICLDVLNELRDRLDGTLPKPPGWFREKIENGETGRKSGKGFYTWKDGRKAADSKKEKSGETNAEMTDRLVLSIVNTSAACLREGVVEDADLLDAAMIFATGFAPFRGGPAKYARDRGLGEVRNRLDELARAHGDRFRPDEGLDRLKEPAGEAS